MQMSRWLRPARNIVVLGLALSLLAIPMAARADDDDDENAKEPKTIRIYRHDNSENAVQSGAFLGVQVQDVTRALRRARDLPTSEGALVNRVEEESPAANGGIRRGDVIVEVDGKKVGDAEDLIEAVREQAAGNRVRVTLWRSGSLKTVSVTLSERPKDFMMRAPGFPGMRMGDDEDRVRITRPREELRPGRMNEQLRELEAQLERLREVEIPRLQDEIRALRQEMRRSQADRDEDRDRDDRDDENEEDD